jgi:hypothetical protein
MWQSISYYALLALESVVGVFGIRLYEEPTYEVIARANDRVEIRRYAPRLAAEVAMQRTDKETRGDAFRLLFDYIAGDNRGVSGPDLIAMTVPVAVREPERVAMTAPVESTETDGTMRMRFFLPAKYTLENAPEPLDDRVRLLTVPAQTIAALRYSGSRRDFENRQNELVTILEGTDWRPLGQPYTLYYDAPFTLPFMRRNEAAIPVAGR